VRSLALQAPLTATVGHRATQRKAPRKLPQMECPDLRRADSVALTERQIRQRKEAGVVSQSTDTRIKNIEANVENLSAEHVERLEAAVLRWRALHQQH